MDSSFCNEMMREYAQLPLRDVVLLTLRKAILTGRLQPGDRLMEIQLSQQMGVSRTPVRDAIRNLEMEGLVSMSPHKGAHVASISEKGVKDVLEVRRTLEGLSVSRATRRISKEQLAALNEARQACENAMKNDNREDVVNADIRFHEIIVTATGNDRLVTIMNNLSDQIFRYRYEFIKDSQHYDAMIKEHRAIYEAMLARDEDGAVAALQCHIDHQAEAILSTLGN